MKRYFVGNIDKIRYLDSRFIIKLLLKNNYSRLSEWYTALFIVENMYFFMSTSKFFLSKHTKNTWKIHEENFVQSIFVVKHSSE